MGKITTEHVKIYNGTLEKLYKLQCIWRIRMVAPSGEKRYEKAQILVEITTHGNA